MASVRRATLADLDAVAGMGIALHEEAPNYRAKTLNVEKGRRFLASLIESPQAAVWVAESATGEIQGMLLLVACDRWFSDERYAADIVLYVKPAARGTSAFPRLVAAGRAWAREQGIPEISFGVSTGVHAELTVCALRKMGMRLSGYMVTDDV